MRRCASSGISGTTSPRRFASIAISTSAPPGTVTTSTRSLADSIPMTQLELRAIRGVLANGRSV